MMLELQERFINLVQHVLIVGVELTYLTIYKIVVKYIVYCYNLCCVEAMTCLTCSWMFLCAGPSKNLDGYRCC